jgi:serine/threonine protein kinase/tetratricopeptide (TPR) repeat protein
MQITPERWQAIKEVFEGALELEGYSRAAFLDEACVGDPSLRAEVVELIASHERAGNFMAAAAFEPALTRGAEEASNSPAGCRIGSYETIREIGRGGMGTVYLAARADEEYRKHVAIKVVKRGMDTEAVVRGFRKERQILAGLDHPHIARLFDGGSTDDGLPYFVMEFIEGLPVDVYCDTRNLSIIQRLELFRTVCSAVQCAHQHGVVHRDLKPSNILVTVAGVPKLLDFGIAKVLDPEAWSATAGTMITRPLTPAYASPEQVRGEEITPASDIYSLGVMLYELLAGHRPYHLESHTPQDLERVICKQEPEKPSTIVSRTEEMPSGDDGRRITITPASVSAARHDEPKKLRQRLAGDLDNIVLMALRKEPGRRYASVEQFSDDIQRHLDGLPVLAHPDTLAYRTAKFVRRNRIAVMTAASSFVAILAVIATGLYAYGQIKRAPDSPQNLSPAATRVRVRSLAVLPFQPLVGGARDEALESGMASALIAKLSNIRQLSVRPTQSVLKYSSPIQDPRVAGRELGVDALLTGSVRRADDRLRLSVELIRVGDGALLWAASFDESWAGIFAVEDAIADKVAQSLTLRLTGADRERLARRDTGSVGAYQEYMIGRHFWNERTAAGLKRGLAHFEKAIELDDKYALAYAGVADSYVGFATFRVQSPKQAYVKAREAAIKALKLEPELSEAYSALAMVSLYHDWDWGAAEGEFKRAISLNPEDATARQRYALALAWFERFEEALREIARARELDPVSPLFSSNVGQILYFAGRYGQAIQELEKALAVHPGFYQLRNGLGITYVLTGAYDRAIAEFQRAIGSGNPEVEANLAHAYAVSRRPAEARKTLDQLLVRSSRSYVSPFDVAVVYAGLGDRDQAFAWLEKAFDERPRTMLSLKINRRLDPLRSDPRFADLVRRVRVFAQ